VWTRRPPLSPTQCEFPPGLAHNLGDDSDIIVPKAANVYGYQGANTVGTLDRALVMRSDIAMTDGGDRATETEHVECRDCGKNLSAGATACPRCGGPVVVYRF